MWVWLRVTVQGDREKREGLPISPNMNRDTTDQVPLPPSGDGHMHTLNHGDHAPLYPPMSWCGQAELSINFCDFIVAPEYAALSTMLPKASACVACIVDNRSRCVSQPDWHIGTLQSGDRGAWSAW